MKQSQSQPRCPDLSNAESASGAESQQQKPTREVNAVSAHSKRVAEKSRREKSIENDIRVALHGVGVLCFKNHTDNRQMHTGLGIGCADLIAVVPPHGRFLGIEVKSNRSGSRTNANQDRWLVTVQKYGGVSGVARSVEEALALVELARRLP